MKISLLGSSTKSLLIDFDSAKIKYKLRTPPIGRPQCSGETIEFLNAIPWGSIATVLVAWLVAGSKRKIIILDKNKVCLHAEGMSVKEIEKAIKAAKSICAVEANSIRKARK